MSTVYEQEIAAFRAKREARLVSPDGWFALVERIWLDDGENEVPFGKLSLWGGRLRVSVAPGQRVTRGGCEVHEIELRVSDAPDVLEHDGRRYDAVRIGARWSLRVRDSAVAARAGFKGVSCYPVDPRWRIEARLEPYESPRRIDIPFTSDEVQQLLCPGVLPFVTPGGPVRLEPLLQPGETRLFLLFADTTNRTTTYGGGRFLYAPLPDESGATVIDFNKACNPACVFNPLVICPLPPQENHLQFAVEAGEKRWP